MRIPPAPNGKARITRIGDRLILLSVPVEARLDPSAAGLLTAAERAVVEHVLEGLSNAAVARKRRVSPRTIAKQLASAYQKLGVGSRRELAARYSR